MIRDLGLRATRTRGLLSPRGANTRRRPYSIKPEREAPHKQRSRAERITSRLPRFLQRYTAPLLNAPLTHVTAFLILHELTAVVPLLGLAGFFHYSEWLPPYISEGKWVSDGVQRFGNYFRKKGWLGDDGSSRYMWWGRGEGGVRVVVEYASSCCALGCSVDPRAERGRH